MMMPSADFSIGSNAANHDSVVERAELYTTISNKTLHYPNFQLRTIEDIYFSMKNLCEKINTLEYYNYNYQIRHPDYVLIY